MNIIGIMTDLIGRQKISRRHTHSAGSGKSLIEAAGKFRKAQTVKTSFSFRRFLARFKPAVKRRKSRKEGNLQNDVKRRSSTAEWMKPFKKIADKFSDLSMTVYISAAAIVIIGTAAVYFTNAYLEKCRLFDELSLHSEAAIEDILYDSLPSDYDGRGSGEIAGIEPVLLTSGEPVSYKVKSGDTLSEIAKKQ